MTSADSLRSPTATLNTGAQIPLVGLGVFQAQRGEETQNAVLKALELGYRHIDTARIYGNEADVARAIERSGVPRSEVFLTTKLWNSDQGYDSALRAFEDALARMKLQYVDLFLLHWPVPTRRLESWRALELLHAQGRARAIGVSNFMVNHLTELLATAKVKPSVNQIELSPFLQQREVVAFCHAQRIVVEAYSPLTKGSKLSHPVVVQIAHECRRTAAQVLLRWGIQSELVVLPKSTNAARLSENLALFDFELTSTQMSSLNALEQGWVTGWDPRNSP